MAGGKIGVVTNEKDGLMPASFYGKIQHLYYGKNYLLVAKTSSKYPRLQMFVTSQKFVMYIAFNNTGDSIQFEKVVLSGDSPQIYYAKDGDELNIYITGSFGDISKIEHFNLIKKYYPETKYTGKMVNVDTLPSDAIELV